MNESYHRYPWRLFFLLVLAAMASVLALLPYFTAMLGTRLAAHPLPLPCLVLIQSFLNFSIATGFGLLAARAVGLGAPIVERWLYRETARERRSIAPVSVVAGLVLGVVTLLVISSPAGTPLRQISPIPEGALPLWKGLCACAYGGLGEEVLMRLFLLSGLLWIAIKIFRRSPAQSDAFLARELDCGARFWRRAFTLRRQFACAHI